MTTNIEPLILKKLGFKLYCSILIILTVSSIPCEFVNLTNGTFFNSLKMSICFFRHFKLMVHK